MNTAALAWQLIVDSNVFQRKHETDDKISEYDGPTNMLDVCDWTFIAHTLHRPQNAIRMFQEHGVPHTTAYMHRTIPLLFYFFHRWTDQTHRYAVDIPNNRPMETMDRVKQVFSKRRSM